MTHLTAPMLQTLRTIKVHGAISQNILQDLMPDAPIGKHISHLSYGGWIAEELTTKETRWVATRKGLRALAPKLEGAVAGPKRKPSDEPYTGHKSIPARVGSMDAYAIPSRDGDTRKPYRPPLILGGRTEKL